MKFKVNLTISMTNIVVDCPDEQHAVLAATDAVHRALEPIEAETTVEHFDVRAVQDA